MENVTIAIKDYAKLIRYKTYLEMILAVHFNDRSWASSDIINAINELIESEDENA